METVVSVVIPVYNEEATLPRLFERLLPILEALQEPFELILVDDGSADRSAEIIEEKGRQDPRVKLLQLSRNFGQHPALSAGIDHASGQAVILMDADLQDPPDMVPRFLAKWREGYHIVYAVKTGRDEGFIKNILFRLFYRILNMMSTIPMPAEAGIFGLMDRKVARVLSTMPERNRYLSGMRCWAGFKHTGIEFQREKREAGASKSLYKLFLLALDAIFSFSYVPVRLVGILGVTMTLVDFLLIIFILHRKYFTDLTIPGWTSLTITILGLSGIQFLVLGIFGEYIARIYEEAKGRPTYVVMHHVNIDARR